MKIWWNQWIWRKRTNIDLVFISVWNRLSAKVLVNLKLFWNLMKSMDLRKTYEVLCSNSFWIEFVWWVADSEEENCDGFIMVLGGRKPVLNLLNENTCSVYWNAFDSRSDARTWISVLCTNCSQQIYKSTTSQLMIVQFSTTPASRTCRARFI